MVPAPTTKAVIEWAAILYPGETPNRHSSEPMILKGPWGTSPQEACEALRVREGLPILGFWYKQGDDTIWICTRLAALPVLHDPSPKS